MTSSLSRTSAVGLVPGKDVVQQAPSVLSPFGLFSFIVMSHEAYAATPIREMNAGVQRAELVYLLLATGGPTRLILFASKLHGMTTQP